jgi:hopanoid biosynthesis associated RND transporter like protein HpnN
MHARLASLVGLAERRPWLVLAAAALVAAASAIFAAGHLGINTDTAQLLSADLPWQKQSAAFDKAFPAGVRLTTIVLDGRSADAVEDGTAALAAALAKRTDLFLSVRRPDGGPFFDRWGLTFLSSSDLQKLSNQLAEAQPLLGPLAVDPSLRGLFGVLDQSLTGLEMGAATPEQIVRPMADFAKAIDSVSEGHPQPVEWSELMTGQAPRPEQLRHFILVQPRLDFDALEPGARASAAIRAAADSLGLRAKGVRVRLTGEVPLEDEEFASVSEGTGTATLVTIGLVAMLLFAGLRAPRIILAILVTLAVGLVTTAGFAALAVGTLNMISVAFAVLFIGIGVDFGIQFSMRYRAELHAATGGGVPNTEENGAALRATAGLVAGPLAVASIATAVGFYAYLPTDYRGVSELGLIAGTGMLIALLANLTVLPALLALLPGRGRSEAAGFAWASGIDDRLGRRARLIGGIAILAAAASFAAIPFVRFDADPLDLKDPTKESVRTARDLTSDTFASPYGIDVLAASIDQAAALARRLEAVPSVRQVVTLASFMPDDLKAKLDILDETRLLLGPVLDPGPPGPASTDADERQALRRFLDHLKRVLATPAGQGLGSPGPALAGAIEAFLASPNGDVALLRSVLLRGFAGRLESLRAAMTAGPLTLDTIPSDLRDDWVAADGRARIAVFPRGNMRDPDALSTFVDAVRAVAPDATGAPVAILESGRTISHAFLTATLLALVGITLTLTIVLRDLRDVILVLVPLLLAGLYSMATCVVTGLDFNFANVIAIPLLLGIGVAFDIYFVMAARLMVGPPRLLGTATARAVVFSAATTGTAFGSLMLSHHTGTASMGLLLAMTLVWVLVATLVVQPALMTLWPVRRPS